MLKILLDILLYGALFLAFLTPVDAAEMAEKQAQTAATVYNVAKFVQWPAETFTDPTSPLVICVLGNAIDDLGFTALEGKQLGKRAIQIRQLGSLNDYKNGQILYLPSTENWEMDRLISIVQLRPVLTISDKEGFATSGGIVNLVKAADNIRFAINLDASIQANLQLSSKLNALASEIIRNKQ